MVGKIVADRRDRMGARLMVLANVFRICQDYDLPYGIYWSMNDSTSPELLAPETLFSQDFIDSCFLSNQEWLPKVKAATNLAPPFNDLSSVDDLRRRLKEGEYFLCGNPFSVITLPWEDAAEVNKRFTNVLETIPFSALIKTQMKAIKAALKGDSNVACHIRRGDIITNEIFIHKSWPRKYTPTVFYENVIETELSQSHETKILVFSDTQQELNNLSQRFPILTFNDIVEIEDLNSAQRDFLELYAMSQCDRIYAPEKSGFSNIAIEFGNGERITTPKHISLPQKRLAYNELVRRLENEPKRFLNHADLSQSIVFAVSYLRSLGDIERASRMLEKYIRADIKIEYLYALLADCKLTLGQDVELRSLYEDIFCKRTMTSHKEAAAIHLQMAIAEYRLGNVDNLRSFILSGLWHAPHDLISNQIVGFFINKGILTPDTFFPYDPVLFTNAKIEGYAQHLPAENGGNYPIFNGDLFTRDWNGRMTMRLRRNHNAVDQLQEKINQLQTRLDCNPKLDISLMSAMSVYHRVAKETGVALALAEEVFEGSPETALYAKRLGDVFDANKDSKNALKYARRAVSLSGNHPCYLVDLARRQFKSRQKKKSAETIEVAMTHATDKGLLYPDLIHLYFIIMRDFSVPEELFDKITHLLKLAAPKLHY